jgi:hypothetical protein
MKRQPVRIRDIVVSSGNGDVGSDYEKEEVGRGRGQGIEEAHGSRETRLHTPTEANGNLNRELCQVREARKG